MLIKIEEDKPETKPEPNQYIAFKCGEVIFVGIYIGENKASPFAMNGGQAPTFVIEEWFPIRLWA